MGDRISISFKKGKLESIALFSHKDGLSFLELAKKYVSVLKAKRKGKIEWPLDRLEPDTVMLDFIRYLIAEKKMKEVKENYYVGKDKNYGDNSDNGHFVIDLEEK